ncbi:MULTISPECIES: hypothetical protein [unclassified Nodularia (in: cyanobacteria)]|nr:MULTISPECIES: hypothetical protein [unclassified Nodularia (in: cyanobacteria)]MBE9199644.1 hypothetical protein [Nodularia sp. LEGE 06071]
MSTREVVGTRAKSRSVLRLQRGETKQHSGCIIPLGMSEKLIILSAAMLARALWMTKAGR